MNMLADQVALVTGASRGIGRAVALELARAGAAVVINYHEAEDRAQAVMDEVIAAGGDARIFQADVSDPEQVRRLVAFALQAFGRLDILVCNAGIVRDQLAAAMRTEQWDSVIATNLSGTFLCVREALPEMMRCKRGSIVLLSSVAADRGSRGHCNYAAAKGGVNALVRALAVELAPKRIRVNGVAPGVIVTDMTRRIRDMAEDEALGKIPLGRFGQPEEVATAVRFLASPEASYITGEILHVSGGFEA